jgi:hypothetical protein
MKACVDVVAGVNTLTLVPVILELRHLTKSPHDIDVVQE